MKKIKTRLCAFFLSVYMVFGVVSTDYLEVQAFEWIAPAIGIEEALKFLLGLLGVSVGAKIVGDNVDWGELKDDCIQHQIEMGNSQVAVSQWWDDVLSGSLNQASSCWSAFKDWVSSFSNSSVVGSSIVSSAIYSANPNFRIESLPSDVYSFNFDCAMYNEVGYNTVFQFFKFANGSIEEKPSFTETE